MKIDNDKYYTPIEIANHCWEKVDEIIGLDNITEIIEPSVGGGSFYHYHRKPDIGYDILPECNYKGVIKGNYLSQWLDYKKGRLVIGNPPYGDKNQLTIKFYDFSCYISDYVAFILPINQLNTSQTLYKFDLIYSEDLGIQNYSGVELHCCFNIYKKPTNGLNDKPNNKYEWIKIHRQDSKNYDTLEDYDIRMCYWGNGCAGKILSKEDKKYSGEYKIKFFIEDIDLKNRIIEFLTNYDWKSQFKSISAIRIKNYHIVDLIIKNFKELNGRE